MSNKRHPYSLIGVDGNIFAVIGYVQKAMKQCGYSPMAIDAFRENVTSSSSYDEALSMAVTMIDNCNILSGYDEFTQLEKGHNGLEYVDQGHMGVQNRIEKLIDESLTNFNFEDQEEQSDEYYQSDDYMILYKQMSQAMVQALNEIIGNGNTVTKTIFKRTLLNIINNDNFWESLDYEVPDKLNEGFDTSMFLKQAIKIRLKRVLNNLIQDGINFSKYDVYHAAIQLSSSYQFYNKLNKYIKD